MLDMGFEPEIRKLVETMGMPPKSERQTLMFSATFPEEIQKLAGDFLNDYLFVTVGRVGGANTDVTQNFFEVDRMQKRDSLCDILSAGGGFYAIICPQCFSLHRVFCDLFVVGQITAFV